MLTPLKKERNSGFKISRMLGNARAACLVAYRNCLDNSIIL